MSVVTRFAPSPSGHLHIGGARSALFCWAFAKNQGGRFMIRIEDTDQARSSEESARGILEDLAWLGIEWHDGPTLTLKDGRSIGASSRPVGPFFQAQRVAIYNAYLDSLMAIGRAYPAFESPEELDVLRKAMTAKKQTYKYTRPADVQFGVAPTERMARAKAGERHVIRFVMPDTPITVADQVLGDVKVAAGEVDDFVIRKPDGFPTYHFAVVIDDELMGVTHVMRAQEHLSNTPRHVALQGALKRLPTEAERPGAPFTVPVYAHMPLIFNMDGTKMSKRDKDKTVRTSCKSKGIKTLAAALGASAVSGGSVTEADFAMWLGDTTIQLPGEVSAAIARTHNITLPEINVDEFKANGYLPEAICNFIALLGWSSGMKEADGRDVDRFDTTFLAKHFAIDRIGKQSAKFDRVKLMAFNGDAIAALPPAEFRLRFERWCDEYEPGFLAPLNEAQRVELFSVIQSRSKTLRQGAEAARFAVLDDETMIFDPAAMAKSIKGGDPAAVMGGGAVTTGAPIIADLRAIFAALPTFDAPSVHQALEAYAAGKGIPIGKVAQPLRLAVTGGTVSPPIDQTLVVLGRERTLRRMERCLAAANA